MLNKSDIIFQRIADNLYVMAKNRFGLETNRVYSKEDILKEYSKYQVEIR